MKATDYIAVTLGEHGVDTVFGYQGSSIAHLIDSIAANPHLMFVESRHEQGAAFAANGYALAKNSLGVALACSGPGALNLISGIADAYYDSIPCLFLTGQVSQSEMRTDQAMRQGGFQETDIISIAGPITKYAVSITDAKDIPTELEKAIGIAQSDRKGPVLIDLPHNIQNTQIDAPGSPLKGKAMPSAPCPADWEGIATRIDAAHRPVMIIGGGCQGIPPEAFTRLDSLNIPVITSYRGKGLYDNALNAYCGTWGVFGERAANWAVKYSDLAICLGTRLDGRQTAYELLQQGSQQQVIVFDVDDAELAKHPAEYDLFPISAESALVHILDLLPSTSDHGAWLETVKAWRERYPVADDYAVPSGHNPNVLLAAASRLMHPDANITVDVGQNQLWSNTSLTIGAHQRLIQSAGLGAMGFALPAAIGAFCANGHQTICITGDGGMQMNIQDLQTISECHFPIKIIILNNRCLGLIRDYQSKALGGRFAGSIEGFGSPDYRLIARAYSMEYLKLDEGPIDSQLAHALDDNASWIIEASIDQGSTACPEPTYGQSIMNQTPTLSEKELEQVRSEAYAH